MDSFHETVLVNDDSHAATTAAEGGLDQNRVADGRGGFGEPPVIQIGTAFHRRTG